MVVSTSAWPLNRAPEPAYYLHRVDKSISFGGSANGTSTGTSATTMTDSGATWTVNAWAGMTCYTNGKSGVISSNTATAVTVASWTGGTPASSNTYMIGAPATTYGWVGTQNVFTTSPSGNGFYIVRTIAPSVSITPVSAGAATLSLGVTGANTLFIAASLATSMTGGWIDTTPNITTGKALPAALKDIFVANNNITIATAVADITLGQIDFTLFWDTVSPGGNNFT